MTFNMWSCRPKVTLKVIAALIVAVGICLPAPALSVGQKAPKVWTGDFNAMVKHRVIRVLVAYNKTNYFLDGARQRGATYDVMIRFEDMINKDLKTKHLKVHIVMIPVARDQLLPYLVQGKGDIAAASLTITPERKKLVDFGSPVSGGVRELVVSGPKTGPIKSVEDLSGRTVHVRKSSSYYESLGRLNQRLKKQGKPLVKIVPVDEVLETEDILEMVNANLLGITIADGYLAKLWKQVFKGLVFSDKVFVAEGGEIAWAIRKNSPQLKAAIAKFIKSNKRGTLYGNIIIKRYFQDTKWVKNAYSKADVARFNSTVSLFEKYSTKYRFDWLMITALAYQESRLDQSVRSAAGAVGVMQVLPSTAAGNPVNISDVSKIEPNIHAGVKYLRFVYDRYFAKSSMDPVDKMLFTFASYNAGPARVAGLRKTAKSMGLNPDVWFRNVEIAAARAIGRETVQYVSNIYKYYIAYRYLVKQQQQRKKSKPVPKTR